MKDIIKITINLVVIYAIGGMLLAGVYSWASPIIFKNKEEDKANALKGMMPIHLVANAPAAAQDAIKAILPKDAEVSAEGDVMDALVDMYKKDKKALVRQIRKSGALSVKEVSDYKPEEKGEWLPVKKKHAKYFEVMDKDDNLAGYIVESYHKGYSGAPGIYVSVSKDLVVNKIEVLTHNETPGLGDEIVKKWFKDQFKGKTLDTLEVVKGEAGDKVQAITGATISSRAVTNGAREAVELIRKYQAGELPEAGAEGNGEVESGH